MKKEYIVYILQQLTGVLVTLVEAWTLCRPWSHGLDIDEEGPWALESWNSGHCMLASMDKTESNFPGGPPSVEGIFAGVQFSVVPAIHVMGVGVSNVAQPSFFGTDNSGNFWCKVAADCCWLISAKKSKAEGGEVWEAWWGFMDETEETEDCWNKSTDGIDDVTGNWNKSIDEAEEVTVSGAKGASKRSKLTGYPETDDRGNAWSSDILSWCAPPVDCSGSETTSIKLLELADLIDMELLSNDPKLPEDVVLWIN